MSRWRITYKGAPDTCSALGYAAASWHTFDKRVWERDGLVITLRNLHINRRDRAYGKIAHYTVTLTKGDLTVHELTGHDHHELVREMKRWVSVVEHTWRHSREV